jgi:hypothetical protein
VKAYAWLPVALLVGLIIGAWAPQADLRKVRAELAGIREAAEGSGGAAPFDSVSRFPRIPESGDRFPAGVRSSVGSSSEPGATNVDAGAAAVASSGGGETREPPARPTRADLRERIEEASEVWRVRADVARSTFLANAELSGEEAVQFDVLIAAMNMRLRDRLETWAGTLRISAASSPGVITEALWRSERFQRMVVALVKNREVAMEILAIPPIALIYGLLAFASVPLLIMLFCSGRIAEDVGSGACRFILSRTSRLAWCWGKYVGQAPAMVSGAAYCLALGMVFFLAGYAVMKRRDL